MRLGCIPAGFRGFRPAPSPSLSVQSDAVREDSAIRLPFDPGGLFLRCNLRADAMTTPVVLGGCVTGLVATKDRLKVRRSWCRLCI